MANNKLSDLRDHLFETLERLKDKEEPMDIARAKAIANVAQTIINSATVEVKAMDAFGQTLTPQFFGVAQEQKSLPAPKPMAVANGKSPRQ